MASQCGAVSTKFLQWHSNVGLFQLSFFQWCSSVPCKYSLGRPVVSQCTLGQQMAFQWHSSVHWTSQCTLAQGKGNTENVSIQWRHHVTPFGKHCIDYKVRFVFKTPMNIRYYKWFFPDRVTLPKCPRWSHKISGFNVNLGHRINEWTIVNSRSTLICGLNVTQKLRIILFMFF